MILVELYISIRCWRGEATYWETGSAIVIPCPDRVCYWWNICSGISIQHHLYRYGWADMPGMADALMS